MSDDKITELQLPMAVVARLIKEALPGNAIAKQEAKLAIARAASTFILFLTSATTEVTAAANQKTMTANHVFKALKDIEFESFIPELEKSLENYRKIMKTKKDRKSVNDSVNNAEKAGKDDNEEEVVELDDD
jgi:DNA polymerase epsilon subunit 3